MLPIGSICFLGGFELNCITMLRLSTQIISLILLLGLVYSGAKAQSGYITTIAGNGVTQYIGDGYPATSLSLATPSGMCIDAAGNVYSTDFASHRIRKITPTDSIYTIGGTGVGGYTGDNGQATNARVDRPYGITIDTSGNLYIVDMYDDVVRKIAKATGVVSTICGIGIGGYYGDNGPATAAHMEQPTGICIDNTGNLYIADKGNNRIRKISTSTGIITTVAGTGTMGYGGDDSLATAAKLSNPTGACIDNITNDLYIADYNNHRIRKVDGATGIITTVAGTGIAGYGGNAGLAVNAQLTQPNAVYMSKQGNLYISDYGNNVIRIVDHDHIIGTIAGNGNYGYSGDGGPAPHCTFIGPLAVCTDDMENIYIADGTNSAIRKVQFSPVGISSINRVVPLTVYPNPTTGVCVIDADILLTGTAQAVVCNTLGMTVYTAVVSEPKHRIDLSEMPSGVYYIRLLSGEEVKVGKVIKE